MLPEENFFFGGGGRVVYGTTNCPGEMHLPNLHMRVSEMFHTQFHILRGQGGEKNFLDDHEPFTMRIFGLCPKCHSIT